MDLLKDLNEPQRRAVTCVDGPLLVLAGAGSGKTRVITRRVAYLVQQGIAPWNVLALTFTNKAAGEMARRVEELGTPHGATVSTFHSLCARLLREFAAEAGLSRSYSIYDSADQQRLAKRALERAELPASTFTPSKALAGVSRAKMHLKTPEAFEQQAGDFYGRQLAKFYRAYQSALQSANALDFDDLLMRMAFLLRDRPDVRQLLAERYHYVLIDEYQDTNHAQYVIAHGIALEHENICATGDPDQSIYAWRGADIGNILDFEKDYPNATVVRLEENYRSTAPILAAAGRLIARNRNRKDKALFTRRAGGEEVTVLTADDEHAEAAEAVRHIAALTGRGLAHSDIAVFYRLNSLSRVIEEVLRKSGVPYRIARGVEFYNRKEIKDVLAYLKLLANPADEVSCERIINVPARGIGETTIGRLRAFAAERGLSLFDAARQARQVPAVGKAAAAKVEGFVQLIDQLAGLADGKVRPIVEAVVERAGLEADLKLRSSEDSDAQANVAELITTAAEFDAQHEGASLLDYLNQVALVSDVDRFEGGGGAVTLMTLHAAKGLEFPAVIMIGCEEGLLPYQRIGDARNDIEEERRLCFVGMTRAREHLLLSCARYRSLRGVRTRQVPSPFLHELGQDGVRRVDVSQPADGRASATSGHDDGDAWLRDEPAGPRDEFFDSDVDRELTAEAERSACGLKAGSRVRHGMFGAGRVATVKQVGPYTRVVVEFDRFGRKTLIMEYARLELLP